MAYQAREKMRNKSFEEGGHRSAHFGPCKDCPKMAAPAFQLTADPAGSPANPNKKKDCPGCAQKKEKGSGDFAPCHETARRAGRPGAYGTAEHELIQADFKATRGGYREYQIPTAGSGGGYGYADLADPLTGGIYEIKWIGKQAQAVTEVDNYVQKANEFCAPNNWSKGVGYSTQEFDSPSFPGKTLVAAQVAPGVIGYWERQRKREKKPVPDPVPVPDRVPERIPVPAPGPRRVPVQEPGETPTPEIPGIGTRIAEWVDRVLEGDLDPTKAAREFLGENPGYAWAILIAGTIGIAALVADDLTIVGIADDAAIPVIAALMAVAWEEAW